MKKYLLVINPKNKDIKILEYVITNQMSGYVNIFNHSQSLILRFWDILKESDNLEDIIGTNFIIDTKEETK
jgi:hypothetical protein